MEYLNKIELKGVVGSVHSVNVGDTAVVRFSVMTEYAYNGTDGGAVAETTWFNCTAWKSNVPNADTLAVGDYVHLTGRVRAYTYVSASGDDRYGWEIMVKDLKAYKK